LVSRRLEDKNESLGIGLEDLVLLLILVSKKVLITSLLLRLFPSFNMVNKVLMQAAPKNYEINTAKERPSGSVAEWLGRWSG